MQDACLHVVVSMTLGWGKQRSLCMGANQDNSGYVTGYSTLGGCIYDVFLAFCLISLMVLVGDHSAARSECYLY